MLELPTPPTDWARLALVYLHLLACVSALALVARADLRLLTNDFTIDGLRRTARRTSFALAAFVGAARPLGRWSLEPLLLGYVAFCAATLCAAVPCAPVLRRRLFGRRRSSSTRRVEPRPPDGASGRTSSNASRPVRVARASRRAGREDRRVPAGRPPTARRAGGSHQIV